MVDGSEDESAYMSSEGSQRGLYTEDGVYGVYDSPSGRPMKPLEYVPSPLQKQPSVYAERGQRRTPPPHVEATTPSSETRAPYKRTRLSEAYDHDITLPASQKALGDDMGESKLGSFLLHRLVVFQSSALRSNSLLKFES